MKQPATKSSRNAYTVLDLTDHRLDVAELSLLERGAYESLRSIYLEQAQPLTADLKTLYRLVVATDKRERQAVVSVLSKRFTLVDGCYRSERCERELARIAQRREAARANGKSGAQARWGTNYGEAMAEPIANRCNEGIKELSNEGNERNTSLGDVKPLPGIAVVDAPAPAKGGGADRFAQPRRSDPRIAVGDAIIEARRRGS
jgi:uncharacterized protein YdaU (DUF1376 family)